MTNELHDSELQALLLDADPVDVTSLRDIADSAGAVELRDAITREPGRATPLRRRPRLAVLAVAAAAAASIPLAVTLLVPSSSRDSAYAAQVVQFAQHSPKLLVAAHGWRVTDLNQTYVDTGEMTFRSGSQSIDIDWDTPASSFGPVRDEVTSAVPVTIDGHRALVGPVGGSGPTAFAALWSVGDQGIRVRGQFKDRNAFVAVAQTLHRVSVSTFLAALPTSVITPDGRKAAVDKMLADIPQPPGFDPSGVSTSTLLLDRYQLGAHVTSAVSCGWLDLWLHGNAAQHLDASKAMQTSRHWAILREMAPEGGWSQSIWEVADNMNGKPLRGLTPGETEAEILKNHLGC